MKLLISAPTCCTAIPPVTDFIFHLFSKKTPSSLPGHGVFLCSRHINNWSSGPIVISIFYFCFLTSPCGKCGIVRISYGLIVSSISFSFTPSAPSIGFSRRSVSSADAIASAQCRVTFVLAFSTSEQTERLRRRRPLPSSQSQALRRVCLQTGIPCGLSLLAPATAFAGTFRFRASCSVPASRHVPACGYRE